VLVREGFEVNAKIKLASDVSVESHFPRRATLGSACFDVFARLPIEIRSEGLEIFPGEWRLVGTGLFVELDPSLEIQVRSRSGLALKKGIVVLNSPGTVDSDYRGELGVILFNHGNVQYRVLHGDAIAQIALGKVVDCDLTLSSEIGATARGEGGFGSTDGA
jgi:dUTP pyrophosphatase